MRLAARGGIEVFTSRYILDKIEEALGAIKKTLLKLLETLSHSELEETGEILYLAKRYVKDVGLTYMDAIQIRCIEIGSEENGTEKSKKADKKN
ncbi:MAG: hypothetical protein QME47_06345 [Candidatus Thermoplasmatota archaeon]|nr:hypothetical protein [Candidatus Thermoplasmatota archaeon]